MDGCFSSWTKTPVGTCARVDPSLDSISAPTLLSDPGPRGCVHNVV
jgi:hypothetical protein